MVKEKGVRKVQALEAQELDRKVEELLEKIRNTKPTEEEIRKREEFHRKVSYISPEALLRTFTI